MGAVKGGGVGTRSTSRWRRAAALPASSSALVLTFSRSVVSLGLGFPSCKTGLIHAPAISLKAFPSLSQKKMIFFPFFHPVKQA